MLRWFDWARWTRGFLSGSGRQSVTPYVHWNCIAVCEKSARELVWTWVQLSLSVATRSFYSSRLGSYIKAQGPTSGFGVAGTLYSNYGYYWLGVANDDLAAWEAFCPVVLPYRTRSVAWSRPVRLHHHCSHDQGWPTTCGGCIYSCLLARCVGLTGHCSTCQACAPILAL
jgi:hypothetical protein